MLLKAKQYVFSDAVEEDQPDEPLDLHGPSTSRDAVQNNDTPTQQPSTSTGKLDYGIAFGLFMLWFSSTTNSTIGLNKLCLFKCSSMQTNACQHIKYFVCILHSLLLGCCQATSYKHCSNCIYFEFYSSIGILF